MDFSDENLLPGIHNYCDRWCERCPQTMHCAVYQMEHKGDIESETKFEIDLSNEDFLKKLSDVFEKTIELIYERSEEMGIDISKINIENLEIKEHTKGDLEKLAELYSQRVKFLIKKYDLLISDNEVKKIQAQESKRILINSITVIKYYSDFIYVKMMRAFTSLEIEKEYDTDEDLQLTDHLGTAKVCIIAIERSLNAFSEIYTQLEDYQDDFIIFLVMLSQLRDGMLEIFPTAMDFIRPGLDS